MVKIPWETTDDYIRSGHRDPSDFEQDSLRTITLSEDEGVKAVIGKLKGEDKTTVQSYLFDKDKWTLDKAKAWFQQHHREARHEHFCYVTPILEKIVDEPLKIRGIALTAGMSRNLNIYLPEELKNFASKLIDSPVYVEHVSAFNAIGKVTKADWDPNSKTLFYEAEIYDDEAAEKIRKGLIQHVSVGADYERIDILDGKVPHGLHNAELSLVAVPGVPQTSIQIMEKLEATNQALPHKMGEQNQAKQKECVPEKQTEQPQLQERVWTRNYINNLPDSAFATILPGGEKDESGKTVPRTLRKFPHHNANGKIDLPHLRNANARVPQSDLTAEQKEQAMRHLARHKKAAGIGVAAEEAKLLEQEEPQKDEHGCTIGKQRWVEGSQTCVPIPSQAKEQAEVPPPEVPEEFEAAGKNVPEWMDDFIASIEDAMETINKNFDDLFTRVKKLEQAVQKPEGEKALAEELLKPSQNPHLIDKREILRLIPEQRIVRSWSYGPRLLVNQIKHKLSQSSKDRE